MSIHNLFKILSCPDCQSKVIIKGKKAYCQSCKQLFPLVSDTPVMLSRNSFDIDVTRDQWDENYLKWMKGDISKYLSDYRKYYLEDTLKPINNFWKIKQGSIYCEIGCGPAIVGLSMAKKGCLVSGVDLSLEGLKLAKDLYKKEKVEGFFVCGDIIKMPFKTESIDFIYGGGVLEHFKDTGKAVESLYKVLRKGGRILITVPFISLSTFRR